MRAVLTRVKQASVTIEGVQMGAIGQGYLVLLGIGPEDTRETAEKLAEKIVHLRVFEDETGRMNRDIATVGGSILVVSQFTLYADTAHGRRPGFSNAARPEKANPLYERVVAKLREKLGPDRVGTGRFGADMKVELLNDGPVSVELLAGAQ